jgi:hypothetical protein
MRLEARLVVLGLDDLLLAADRTHEPGTRAAFSTATERVVLSWRYHGQRNPAKSLPRTR